MPPLLLLFLLLPPLLLLLAGPAPAAAGVASDVAAEAAARTRERKSSAMRDYTHMQGKLETLDGYEIVSQRPAQPRAVLALFHGCSHSAVRRGEGGEASSRAPSWP